MKLTNKSTRRSKEVSQKTLSILNYVAAKSFSCKGKDNTNGFFFCSIEDVSKATEIPLATAFRHLVKLCELGVLKIRKVGGSKSIYKVNPFEVTTS